MTDEFDRVDVVTCFLRHDAEVLLFRRSDEVGSYAGRWGAVAGHAEGDPRAATREEIREETGLDPDADVALVRAGDPFTVEDADRGTRWVVHPFLFDADTRDVETNYETSEYEWTAPTEILRRETVPDLWKSYDRVRPDVEAVAADHEHGSAYLSLRALEVLRDEAALISERGVDDEGEAWQTLRTIAERLREVRPAMPVVANRVNRAMAAASEDATAATERAAAPEGGAPEQAAALERAATAELDRALAADDEAAALAAERLRAATRDAAGSPDGSPTVATLSRSGTVHGALERAAPEEVVVAESRPGREGVATAESLAEATGAAVTVTTDAAFPGHVVDAEVDALLVGADAVLPDGRVVNKVGTRAAAAVAADEAVACYAVAATDKVARADGFDPEPRDDTEVYDGDAALDVANPTFEATPAALFDAVLTEAGALDADDLREVADAHRDRADW
ncbi:MAG: NUDIX domain-containing protein [Haloarculaceae archaeon]